IVPQVSAKLGRQDVGKRHSAFCHRRQTQNRRSRRSYIQPVEVGALLALALVQKLTSLDRACRNAATSSQGLVLQPCAYPRLCRGGPAHHWARTFLQVLNFLSRTSGPALDWSPHNRRWDRPVTAALAVGATIGLGPSACAMLGSTEA